MVTYTKLDLYVNDYSHSRKPLWSTLLNLLEGKFYFHDIVSDTMVTKLSIDFTLLLLLYYKTYELTNFCVDTLACISQVHKATTYFWRFLAWHGHRLLSHLGLLK